MKIQHIRIEVQTDEGCYHGYIQEPASMNECINVPSEALMHIEAAIRRERDRRHSHALYNRKEFHSF